MKRVVLLASLMTFASAGVLVVAQQTSTVPQPRANALPAPGTGSPKVSRTVPKPEALVPTVPAGFTVQLYAREPLVRNPCAMAFDARGRLFVGQGPQYRNPKPTTPGDTIELLIDSDGDGMADKAKTFARGLNCVQGLAWHGRDLWVANAPDLTIVRDLDGDDEADEYVRVFTDLGNIEHALHGLNWAPDGKLYMSKGTSKGLSQPGRIAPKPFRDLWGVTLPAGTPEGPEPPRVYKKGEYRSTYQDPADSEWYDQEQLVDSVSELIELYNPADVYAWLMEAARDAPAHLVAAVEVLRAAALGDGPRSKGVSIPPTGTEVPAPCRTPPSSSSPSVPWLHAENYERRRNRSGEEDEIQQGHAAAFPLDFLVSSRKTRYSAVIPLPSWANMSHCAGRDMEPTCSWAYVL
jgi:hypothetical protein